MSLPIQTGKEQVFNGNRELREELIGICDSLPTGIFQHSFNFLNIKV